MSRFKVILLFLNRSFLPAVTSKNSSAYFYFFYQIQRYFWVTYPVPKEFSYFFFYYWLVPVAPCILLIRHFLSYHIQINTQNSSPINHSQQRNVLSKSRQTEAISLPFYQKLIESWGLSIKLNWHNLLSEDDKSNIMFYTISHLVPCLQLFF